MEPAAFFSLPLWRDYTFQIVLAGTTILGVLCGVVGSFIVLRREALLGTVFPIRPIRESCWLFYFSA